MGSEDMDSGSGMPRFPRRLNGYLPQGLGHWRRREKKGFEADRGDSRRVQQKHLEMELHVKHQETLRLPGSVALCCWRRQAGGTTGSRRNREHPAWSVADESQEPEGDLQPAHKETGPPWRQ